MQKNDFNLVVNRIKSYNLLGVSKTVEKHKNSITKKWLGINKMFNRNIKSVNADFIKLGQRNPPAKRERK